MEFAAAIDMGCAEWKRTNVLMDLNWDISDLITDSGLDPTSEIA